MLSHQKWVQYDESKCVDATVELAVQVNGKVKARIVVPANCDKETAIRLAKDHAAIAAELTGKMPIKEVYVPGRLVNIVIK